MREYEYNKFLYSLPKDLRNRIRVGYIDIKCFTEEELEQIKNQNPLLFTEEFPDIANGVFKMKPFGFSTSNLGLEYVYIDDEPMFKIKKHFINHKELLQDLQEYIPEMFL